MTFPVKREVGVCVPLVVEVFGGWGNKAQEALSRIAKKLVIVQDK